MEATATTKILLFNVGYCTGLDGSMGDYAQHFLRYLHTPRRVFYRVFRAIVQLIHREKPDICCFVEVRRVQRFMRMLWQYPICGFENKYGLRSLLRHLPFFRKNSLGFFSSKPVGVRKHFLRHGVKKLIYEIELEKDLSVLMGHFSLQKKTRERQFREMRDLIKRKKRIILCGDFNTFAGKQELESLMKECDLKMVNSSHDLTFPADHPTKAIDLFLCSSNVRV